MFIRGTWSFFLSSASQFEPGAFTGLTFQSCATTGEGLVEGLAWLSQVGLLPSLLRARLKTILTIFPLLCYQNVKSAKA